MGFEVEQKFRVSDPAALQRQLERRGATVTDPVEHVDLYFAHPSRDFAQTGEAFRIRGEGEANLITYKGGRQAGPAKTREEIEVEFAAGLESRDDVRTVFERLGFTVVATVRKRRTSFELVVEGRPMTVTADEAETLGHFAEVETLVTDDGDLAAAQQAVLHLATELGLTLVESRSYLRMILEATGKLPANPPGQT